MSMHILNTGGKQKFRCKNLDSGEKDVKTIMVLKVQKCKRKR